MKPVQYILLNKSLRMSTGKAAAQAAHASVEGLRKTAKQPWGNPWDTSIVNNWYQGGHYTKIVLETDDIATALTYIQERGFAAVAIIDEGRTEFGGDLTPTAVGVEVLDKDNPHVAATFSTFKLYEDQKPVVVVMPRHATASDLDEATRMIRNGVDTDQITEWFKKHYDKPRRWWHGRR